MKCQQRTPTKAICSYDSSTWKALTLRAEPNKRKGKMFSLLNNVLLADPGPTKRINGRSYSFLLVLHIKNNLIHTHVLNITLLDEILRLSPEYMMTAIHYDPLNSISRTGIITCELSPTIRHRQIKTCHGLCHYESDMIFYNC